jgi:hypothetical protein
MTNSWIQHVKHYAATHNVPYPVAMIHARASYTASPKQKPTGGTRGRPRKGGALNLKEFGLQQWDKVPDQYKPGLQSLGEAAYHDVGFGLKKRRGRKTKGGNIFDDIGNAFKPVTDVFRPVADVGKVAAQNPVVKALAKKVAKEILKYGVSAAPAAAAAAATASGNPALAPAAALMAMELANEAQPYGNNYIDGLGMKKKTRGRPKKTHGMALLQAGY